MKSWKWFLIIPSAIPCYFIIALILTFITVNDDPVPDRTGSIYLSTNGNHLYLVIKISGLSEEVLDGLEYDKDDDYLSFGWGDEYFYLNTPTWDDLTFKNAFTALFFITPTLIHVSGYDHRANDWISVQVSSAELEALNHYLADSFRLDSSGNKIIIENRLYSSDDRFYKANGSYTLFNTCNTWVNTAFKQSGLKACLWTPFEFGPRRIYEKD